MNNSEKVIDILKELSGKDAVSETDRLIDDLFLDSLQMVTLLIDIEDHFGIMLDESDMNPFNLITVNDIHTLLKKYGVFSGE